MIWIGLKKQNCKKIRSIINTWYDRLINCIPEPTRKSVSALKDKIASLYKSVYINFRSYSDVSEIFESLLTRYENNLEVWMAGNEFIFIEVQLHYKYYFKRKGYIDSPVWIKNKATINKKNDDVKCLQYAATVQLNHSAIEYNPERVSNIESFISKYN